MPKKDGSMTKAEAKKEVQKLIVQAEGILAEAGKLMDEHQFSVNFMDQSYFPRNLDLVPYDDGQEEEPEEAWQLMKPKSKDIDWMYFYRDSYQHLAGEWKTSSQWRDC
jgi:hypothetical protein